MDSKIEDLLKQMTLEEKASLCSGADSWHTRAIERLGIPAIRVTDGPHGVRRPYEDDRGSWPATSFPTASAMAATWNVDLTRRVGEALGEETRSKGCDILLGPAVNIHRTPLCGRNFEYYSEDPYLAGRLAVGYIQGLQSKNVGASIKHYAANNSEFERTTISSDVDDRTLREIYLPAFQAAIEEADPWTVMCSYNKINGTWASENRYLLTDILREEWGFQGFVVSDWGAVHNRILSSNAGLDLEMPGLGDLPVRILVDAVQRGLVDEAVIDEMVRRILRIVFKARPEGQAPQFEPDASNTPEHRALAREAAEEAIVLLKNEGNLLPLNARKVHSVAVFGPNAAVARIQGGGSAQVNPYVTVSPLEGIQQRAGERVKVTYRPGCKNTVNPPVLDGKYASLPGGSEPGYLVEYFTNPNFSGEPAVSHTEPALRYTGGDLTGDQLRDGVSVRWQAAFQAPVSGEYTFSLSSAGQSRLLIDGQTVTDHWSDPDLQKFWAVWPWLSKTGTVRLEAGQTYQLVVEYRATAGGYRLVAGCDIPLPADELEQVVRAAERADVAVVVVGTTFEHETEGYDRLDWEMPGEQAQLIDLVAKANPRTVVVLNNGAPLGISGWVGKVPAVLEAWFAGQEIGSAVAGVLFGDVNPSGKLPDTLPIHYQDNPSYINYPGENGHVLYGEGIFVGYRYYDMKDIEPLYPFGHGLSYTTFAYENLRLSASEIEAGGTLQVSLDVRNTGRRQGKEVVQLYVRDVESRLVRPPKELKGFHKVDLAPGEVKTVTFTLDQKALSYYDPSQKAWVAEPGDFEILLGSSSRDIHLVGRFHLKGSPAAPRPRLGAHSALKDILADEQGRRVLEQHVPEIARSQEARNWGWITLNYASTSFMEILPPEKLQQITAELEKIQ